MLSFKSFGQPIRFGQLVVWDGQQVLSEHQPLVKETLGADETDWVMNLISVGEGKSYFITDNKDVQGWMSGLLDLQFNGSIAAASRLWLRKEVIKQDIANS
jgi:inorganic pyrophosphatase